MTPERRPIRKDRLGESISRVAPPNTLGDLNPAPYDLGLAILVLVVIFLQALLRFPGLVYCSNNDCYSEPSSG
jgi:hypothetical protein